MLALSLGSEQGRFVLLASVRREAPGAGIVDDRPRGAPADGFTSSLRHALVGASVVEVRAARGTVAIAVRTDDGPRTLVLAAGGAEGAIALLDATGAPRLARGSRGTTIAIPSAAPLGVDALREGGDRLARALEGAEASALRAALSRAVLRARAKLARKAEAIAGDAARASDVPALRADASAILASLHAIPRGAASFDAPDYTTDPPGTKTIALDPALGPKAHAEALFKRARRLERGAAIAEERFTAAAAAIDALDRLAAAIAAATPAELDGLAERAIAAGVRLEVDAPQPRARRAARRAYRTFTSSDGLAILVGRSAPDNDALTLRVARPHDLWLHARGASGSHVVVPLDRDRACPPATLAEAAMLAAHFSRFRGDRDVEVLYTPRRYVRKLRGSAPGSVAVDREKVLLVTMEPERLARLVATERP